jgi:hypothetical protein
MRQTLLWQLCIGEAGRGYQFILAIKQSARICFKLLEILIFCLEFTSSKFTKIESNASFD